jgi:hypothetical protein
MTVDEISRAARALADELTADILTARTREDHVRMTARANTARALAEETDHFAQDREVVST